MPWCTTAFFFYLFCFFSVATPMTNAPISLIDWWMFHWTVTRELITNIDIWSEIRNDLVCWLLSLLLLLLLFLLIIWRFHFIWQQVRSLHCHIGSLHWTYYIYGCVALQHVPWLKDRLPCQCIWRFFSSLCFNQKMAPKPYVSSITNANKGVEYKVLDKEEWSVWCYSSMVNIKYDCNIVTQQCMISCECAHIQII